MVGGPVCIVYEVNEEKLKSMKVYKTGAVEYQGIAISNVRFNFDTPGPNTSLGLA